MTATSFLVLPKPLDFVEKSRYHKHDIVQSHLDYFIYARATGFFGVVIDNSEHIKFLQSVREELQLPFFFMIEILKHRQGDNDIKPSKQQFKQAQVFCGGDKIVGGVLYRYG